MNNKVDINTLTEKQHKQLDMWYKIYLNEDNKLVTEEPTENLSDEFILHKANLIKNKKKVAIENIATITDQINIMASVLNSITADTLD